MKYFPVNTALYDSPKKLRSIYANPDDVIADSDSEKASVSTKVHPSDTAVFSNQLQ